MLKSCTLFQYRTPHFGTFDLIKDEAKAGIFAALIHMQETRLSLKPREAKSLWKTKTKLFKHKYYCHSFDLHHQLFSNYTSVWTHFYIINYFQSTQYGHSLAKASKIMLQNNKMNKCSYDTHIRNG